MAKRTVVHADEAASRDGLHERFEIKRINHQEAYSLDGACANMAEEYFPRRRHAEIGIHHDIAGACLLRYAQESSWREDNRRISNGYHVSRARQPAPRPVLIPLSGTALFCPWRPPAGSQLIDRNGLPTGDLTPRCGSPSPSSRVGEGSPGSGVTRGPGTFDPYSSPCPIKQLTSRPRSPAASSRTCPDDS